MRSVHFLKMRVYLILLFFVVLINVINALTYYDGEDLETAASINFKKQASKYGKKVVNKAKEYVKKGVKSLINAAKDYIKNQMIKSTGPFCVDRVCIFCLSIDVLGALQKDFCGGLQYNNRIGSMRFALKVDDDFVLKKEITGLMKLPDCATVPYLGPICVQGFEFKLRPSNQTWKSIDAKGCIMVIARKVSTGVQICVEMQSNLKKKKVQMNLVLGEERDGQFYTTDVKSGLSHVWGNNTKKEVKDLPDDEPKKSVHKPKQT